MISDGECNVPSTKTQSMKSMITSCHGNTEVIYLWSILVILCWNAAILESLQNVNTFGYFGGFTHCKYICI